MNSETRLTKPPSRLTKPGRPGGAPFRFQGGLDLPRKHGLDKKFLYVHLGGRAEVRARESSLQGKFRQSADNGHRINYVTD